MDLETEIRREHSKYQCRRIARWVGSDKKRFKELMALFLRGEYRTTQRAAWIVMHCAESDKGLAPPYFNRMIDRMLQPGVHDAVKRNVLRILQDVEIPTRMAGKVATICFDLLGSVKEPIAVKVFAMTVLANIAQREPDLKREITILVEQQMPTGSAGFRSRGKKVLKRLEQL